MLIRIVLTLVYSVAGLLLAFPLSYWFQDSIYREMTWHEYIQAGPSVLKEAAQFGAYDTYRITAISCVIGAITIGRLVEWRVTKK